MSTKPPRPRQRIERTAAWKQYVQSENHARKLLADLVPQDGSSGSNCPTIRAIAGDVMCQLVTMAGILSDIREVLERPDGKATDPLGSSLEEVRTGEEFKAMGGGKCSGLPYEGDDWSDKTCLQALEICESWLVNCANVL